MSKSKEMYFLYDAKDMNNTKSAIGVKELAEILGRQESSVRRSISSIKKKKKDFVLKDKDNKNWIVISEEELRKGV